MGIFSLHSPEKIASDYGGNKQKIAQAVQSGLLDPTSATLAGMFIDRVRSAQAIEQQPQGSVASQVLPPAQPEPEKVLVPVPVPVSSHGAGLASLKGEHKKYSSGGVVEKSPRMTESELDALIARSPSSNTFKGQPELMKTLFRKETGRKDPKTGEWTYDPKAVSPAGASGLGQIMPITAKGAHGTGAKMDWNNRFDPQTSVDFAGKVVQGLYKTVGNDPTAIAIGYNNSPAAAIRYKNQGIMPKSPETRDYVKFVNNQLGKGVTQHAGSVTPTINIPINSMGAPSSVSLYAPPEPPTLSDPNAVEEATRQARLAEMPNESSNILAQLMERANQKYTPEQIAANKKQALWASLAQLGANMAASKNSNFLGALGEASAASLPNFMAAINSSKNAKDNHLEELYKLASIKDKAGLDRLAAAYDMSSRAGANTNQHGSNVVGMYSNVMDGTKGLNNNIIAAAGLGANTFNNRMDNANALTIARENIYADQARSNQALLANQQSSAEENKQAENTAMVSFQTNAGAYPHLAQKVQKNSSWVAMDNALKALISNEFKSNQGNLNILGGPTPTQPARDPRVLGMPVTSVN